MALNWRNNQRNVFVSNRGKNMRVRPVNFGRGPIFEHVPREQILWDTAYPIGDAPMVCREFRLQWSDVNHIAHSTAVDTGWIKPHIEDIRGQEGLEGASANIYQSVATIAYTGTRSITEWGIFTTSTGGSLFSRKTFAAKSVVNGDSIAFTWNLTLG